MRQVLLPVVAVAVLALGACDADLDQDDDREPRADVVQHGLAALYSDADTDAPEAICFADALLDRLSLDELVEAGVVGDDGVVVESAPMLTVDVAGHWVDAAASCAPYAEVAARAAGTDPATFAACLDAAVPPERQRTALVAGLSGDFDSEPAAAELAQAQADCAR